MLKNELLLLQHCLSGRWGGQGQSGSRYRSLRENLAEFHGLAVLDNRPILQPVPVQPDDQPAGNGGFFDDA
ncbi:MAG: hypothetical protein A2064_14555 [Spirochaetes bacterium GWB1_66_5]|nr:MAG: hypothetical protein A2064_14555 [Spirochaetes bacterium GWB1_66_5]